jgi:hypothetical protein
MPFPIIPGGSPLSSSYQISRSLRFRRSASGNITRTFGTPTTQNTFTFSCWTKRGLLSTIQIFFAYSNLNSLYFTATDTLALTNGSGTLASTAVFRDPSAWYHILYTQSGTAVNIYVNGLLVVTGTLAVSINTAASAHCIGSYTPSSASYDGYITEVYFVDGQVRAVSDFTATDATTGVLIPKAYTGTYGNNGFYINFSDNSAATATTIGKDYSGNGNNWTPNNISVTSGTTYDSMIDSPTPYADGGNGRGNYCVLNPLKLGSTGTLSNANLTWSSSSNQGLSVGTIGFNSGKWYFEFTCGSSVNGTMPGVAKTTVNSAANPNYPGVDADGWGYYATTGNIFNNGSGTAYGATFTTNDIIGVAVDMAAGKIWWSKNGTFQNSGNPSSGTNAGFSNLPTDGTYLCPAIGSGDAGTSNGSINFGQRPFSYAAPTGFLPLNTLNLSAPTISNGAQYMAAVTYTGNGTTTGNTQTITATTTNSGNNPLATTFQPDLVWIKSRSTTQWHVLVDSVRGVNKTIYSNDTYQEESLSNVMNSFNSDGFTAAYNSTYTSVITNKNSDTYVGWQWKAGGTGVSNTSGSITSTVSANVSAGFSVVTYTGNVTAGATVGHGLGATPAMIIVKDRSNAYNWTIYHQSLSSGYVLVLNSTGASVSSPEQFTTTLPTSSVFSLGWPGSANNTNANTSHVAYCFAPVAGYSAFGSYTGNGSSNGPFVFTGFRSRWVMIKGNNTSNWEMYDTSRDTYNESNKYLAANSSGAEATTATIAMDILSNGFKLRGSASDLNASGVTFYYAAFAENPFTISRAR